MRHAWSAGRCDGEPGCANLPNVVRGSDCSVSCAFDVSQAGSLRACGDYCFRVYLSNNPATEASSALLQETDDKERVMIHFMVYICPTVSVL